MDLRTFICQPSCHTRISTMQPSQLAGIENLEMGFTLVVVARPYFVSSLIFPYFMLLQRSRQRLALNVFL